MRLLHMLILRPLGRDALRTVLTLLSVVLGVAVVVAIDLAGDAATGSFRSSLQTVVGSTDLEIVANGGISEAYIGRLAGLPVNARFSPLIEDLAAVQGIGNVALYGVDLVGSGTGPAPARGTEDSKDGGFRVLISPALAGRLRLGTGQQFPAIVNDVQRTLTIAGVAGSKDAEFLLLDIADAQKLLDRYGKLDRIHVTVSAREDFGRVERQIRAALPASYSVQKPGTRSEENQRMLRAFRWNLRVLSYISLVVGAFLIYNTIAVSVVRRRAEIGILRALGAGRQAVLWLFLGEAAILGITGSIAGVLLGRVLAVGTVGMIAETVNSLYTSSRPAVIVLGFREFLAGVLAGTAVALLSALGPAREAMNVAPTESMGRGSHEHHARLRWRRDLAWAAVLAILAAAASQVQPFQGNPIGGYVSALLSIGAAAFAAPAVVLAVNRISRRAARGLFGVAGMFAGRSLAASLARTSVIVGALATAIAMMASVGIMVGSFRETVLVWLDTQLRADLYIRPVGRSGADLYPALSADLAAVVANTPGVEAVDVFHALELRYAGQRATLGGGNLDIVRRYGRLRFLPGENRDAILRSMPGQDRAIVSEPFANKHGIRQGDRLTIPLGDHQLTFTVAGVYYEYSSNQGYVILDRSTLLKYLPDQPPTNIAVYLANGSDPAVVRREIQKRTAAYRIVIAPNQALRRNALEIFDRTFAITYALEAVAILVAMLGAANSLLALVLDRRRELGLLRYLGASGAQLRRMVVLEAGFLGFLANLLGLALGFVLSLLLIYVVNKQSFGWTIQFHPPAALLTFAVLTVWCTTVIAALYPARVAARLNPIEVIHEE
ncbi:MAG: FtsX-like permease family protein [Bryobacteraceae bacterium]